MTPKLKPPGSKRLKLRCDMLLSTSAFKFNSRRYDVLLTHYDLAMYDKNSLGKVGRCGLSL